jgi:hypothetical protein
MLNRLKRVLVNSFIGAIALGYLFAEAALYFVNIFTAPVATWSTQKIFQRIAPRPIPSTGFPFQTALPHVLGFLVLSLVWYGLLRWLYFPLRAEADPAPKTW